MFQIETDKIFILNQTREDELEVFARPKSKLEKSRVFEEEPEDVQHFEKINKQVKHMKSLSKQSDGDPLSQSMAGVLSLYQGKNSIQLLTTHTPTFH